MTGDSSMIFQLSERSTHLFKNIDTAMITDFTSDFAFGENDETFFQAKPVLKAPEYEPTDIYQNTATATPRRQQQEQQEADTAESELKPKRRISATVKETGFDSMKHYMKTMGNHDLLRKSEEVILAREIQILVQWEKIREGLEQKLLRYVV
jgi:hypothetical protein